MVFAGIGNNAVELKSFLTLDAKRFNDGLGKAGGGLNKFSAGLKKHRTAILAFNAAIFGFGLASLKFASDLEEAQNKSAVTFGDSADAVEEFAETSARNFGIAAAEANSYASTLGVILQASGLSQHATAGMSVELTKLAADLASFNDIPIDVALQKIRSGLVGEVEPLRTVGVLLNAVAVEAKAVELGLVEADGVLTESAKVQARYALILENTTKQQGDFARTSESLANQLRSAQALFKDMSGEIGKRLMPATKALLKAFGDGLNLFKNLPEPIKDFVVVLGVVAGALGAIALALPIVIASWWAFTAAMAAFGVTSNIALAGIPLLIASISAAVFLLVKHWDEAQEGIRKAVNFIATLIEHWVNFHVKAMNAIITPLREIVKFFGGPVLEIPELVIPRWKKAVEELAETHEDAADEIIEGQEELQEVYGDTADTMDESADRQEEAFERIADKVKDVNEAIKTSESAVVRRMIETNAFFEKQTEERAQIIADAQADELHRFIEAIRLKAEWEKDAAAESLRIEQERLEGIAALREPPKSLPLTSPGLGQIAGLGNLLGGTGEAGQRAYANRVADRNGLTGAERDAFIERSVQAWRNARDTFASANVPPFFPGGSGVTGIDVNVNVKSADPALSAAEFNAQAEFRGASASPPANESNEAAF